MSLKTRMAMVAGLAVALAVVIVAVASYEGTKSSLLGSVDQALAEQARPFMGGDDHGGPRGGPGGRPPFVGEEPPPRFGEPAGNVQIVTPSGQVVRPPDETTGPPVDARARQIAASGTGQSYSDATVDGSHVRVLTQGIGPRGAVQVARSLQEVDNVLDKQLLLLILVGAGGIVLAAVLSIVVARTALAPITRFTRRTESLTADPDPSERLEVSGRDELARLAQSFNTTLDALERSVEAQRNLVADASHELRTPIASLRANIQVLEDANRLAPEDLADLRADIISELDELTALVGDIVELARGSRPADRLDDVQLDTLIASLVDRFERRFPDLIFERSLEPTVVSGEPDRIARAVSNLLDNASKWSPAGGTIEVVLAEGTVSVRDHGRGFAEQDLPHVFDRFYRASDARSTTGSGLGLAIVRQAAESHGGAVEALNARGGGGVVRVRFSSPA
jgi:two-component system, OmpR family, sensor histidine kinase MprB